jgi:hypothetical protein
MKKETGSPCSNPFEVSDEKKRPIKAWAVICNKEVGMIAYTIKSSAIEHKDFLDEEYSGCCKHKVVPCEINLF